jgi:hypothetical protein
MNTIHTFGDSFTFGHGCVENCDFKSYYNYKKEGDDIWPVHLSRMLGMNLLNHGKNAYCNERIFDSIVNNFHSIKKNDIIIIEKTFNNRLSIPADLTWISALSHVESSGYWKIVLEQYFSKEEIETLVNFQYYFSQKKLYEQRNNNRFDFLKKILINNIKVYECIIWDMPKIYNNFENVKTATNGKVDDLHFSFKGHKQFSKYIYDIINKKVL